MGFLALLAVYVKEMFFSILAMLGIDKSGGSYMQIVYIGMTIICTLAFVYQMVFRLNISRQELVMIFAFALLLLAFLFVPRTFYRNSGPIYQSQLLTAFSSVLSAFLMGILAKRGNFINAMARVVPWFIIINTISSAMVTFNSSGETTGGYLQDESGFNYQDLSYFIAFTFALNIFYIKNQHKIEGKNVFKRPGWNTFFQCLIPVHLLLEMLSGGRGAFLLLCILMVYYFVMDHSNAGKNLKNFIIMSIVVFVVFVLVSSANLEYSGFERILSLFSGGGDSNRAKLRSDALSVFLRNPFFGNGCGSVYPFFRLYTHNIFTDIMVEYGTVGLVFVVVMIIRLVRNQRSLVRENPCNHLVVLMSMCCFTQLMFSGYYLAVPQLWFVLGYTFATSSQKQQQQKYISKYVKVKERKI